MNIYLNFDIADKIRFEKIAKYEEVEIIYPCCICTKFINGACTMPPERVYAKLSVYLGIDFFVKHGVVL